jgi:TolA-binding protein
LKLFSFILLALGLAAPAAQAGPSRDLELARQLFERQAYGLAAGRFSAYLDSQPYGREAAEALFKLGNCEERLGRLEEAHQAYAGLLARYPGDGLWPEASLSLASVLLAQGQPALALQETREFLEAYPSHALASKAFYLQGESLYSLDHFEEAGQAYAKAEQAGFGQAQYLAYARAWCLFRLAGLPSRSGGEDQGPVLYRRASALFASALALDPDSALASSCLFQQGESEFKLGHFKEAAKLYRRLWDEHASSGLVPQARYALAWCAFSSQDYGTAVEAFYGFSKDYAGQPLAAWAKYMTGVCLTRLGKFEGAEAAYQRTLQDYPSSDVVDHVVYGLAWLAAARKDYGAAVRQYAFFLTKFPKSPLAPSALFLQGDSQYRLERFAAAHDSYAMMASRFPDDPLAQRALFLAASSTLAQADYEAADQEFRAFAERYPKGALADQARVRQGDCAFGLGKLDEAAKVYLEVLSWSGLSPALPGALDGLGWVDFSRGNWEGAYRRWARVQQEFSSSPEAGEAGLHAGDCLYNLGRYGEALGFYRRVSRAHAGSDLEPRARLQAGWALYRLKEFDQARAEWRSVLDSSLAGPGQAAEALYWMSWALFRKGQFGQAADSFASLPERFPGSHRVPESLLRVGDSWYNAGDFEKARLAYQDLVDRFPSDPKVPAALYGIQWCYYNQGRDEEALAASKAFLQRYKQSPFAAEIQYHVAEHYYNRKDWVQAEREFSEVQTAYPGSSVLLPALFWRGMARFQKLDLNLAIADWKALLKADPNHPLAPKALFQTGIGYYRLQEYPQALQAFQQVMDGYGNTPAVAADAQFNLGMTYKRLGKDEEALKAYRATLEGYPGTRLASMAGIRIGYLLEDAKDYPAAFQAYQDLAARDQGTLGAEAQFLAGDCQLSMKHEEEAVKAYALVAKRFPSETSWVATALAKMGELHEQMGKPSLAIADYHRIMKLTGNPAWAASAKERIRLIRERFPKAAPKTGAKASAKTPATEEAP